MMPLLALPNELLLQTARHLACCPTCHCRHICRHLSSLSRCNLRLRTLLTESLLSTASPLHILLWGIVHSRHATVTLALKLGAEPNIHLERHGQILTSGTLLGNTPIDVAISMRVHSTDPESHAPKLSTLALLLGAGGTCTVDSLLGPTQYGDLDLLTLCLPHLQPAAADQKSGPRTLLELAARHSHVEAVQIAIDAGVAVNSTGTFQSAEFLPPLWVCWEASTAVLQVLLDAGADPTWRSRHRVSVVGHIRRRSDGAVAADDRVALLVRYGAGDDYQVTPGEPQWTAVGHPGMEYRGWVLESMQRPVDWPAEWVRTRRDVGCGCRVCPPQITGGVCGRAWR